MKILKALGYSFIAMTFAFWLVACSNDNEGPAENAGEEVDQAAEQVQDKAEQMTDEAQETMEQTGDAIEEETDQQ